MPLFKNSFGVAIFTGLEAVNRKSGEAGSEFDPPLTNAGALVLTTFPVKVTSAGAVPEVLAVAPDPLP
jgi:hypothetical protein